ncbi:MAG: L-histidine N(alpha)-methyltransferase [Bdellovibrionota bacterium]
MKEVTLTAEKVQLPFARDVLTGLHSTQKWVPAKYLYDRNGLLLFERLAKTQDYYPFRAEQEILRTRGREISHAVGDKLLVIEPGSGTSFRVRALLQALDSPLGYVNMEETLEALLRATINIQMEFPQLSVFPVKADYSEGLGLPETVSSLKAKRLVFFPGSAIGNFHSEDAVVMLTLLRRLALANGALLIGIDLKKDPVLMARAYDDSEGAARDFNFNLLTRINRELSGNFSLENFSHQARVVENRVETHLVSLLPQIVTVADQRFSFRTGETILTKNSYKYSVAEFTLLAAKARLVLMDCWLDASSQFGICLFHPKL